MDLDKVVDFFDDLERDPKKGMAYAFGLLALSLALLLIVPSMILGSYDKTTFEQIQLAEVKLQSAELRAPSQDWYAESYYRLEDRRHYQLWLFNAEDYLGAKNGARSLYEQAQFGWPANRIRLYESAQAAAEKAMATTDSVVALFDRNDSLREQVLINQQSIQRSIDQGGVAQEVTQERFKREQSQFLSVYMNPLRDNLRQSAQKIEEAKNFIQTSAGYMPDFDVLTHEGDPLEAQEELDRAQALINEINTLQAKVTSGLDYQIEARDTALSKANQAVAAIDVAEQHLIDVDSQYHWGFAGALLPASTSVANARVNVQIAFETLETFVPSENKIDWPVAYEAAKVSLSQAETSVQEVDQQVGYYTTTQQLLGSYFQVLTNVNSDISSAQNAWSLIETYHSSSVWEGTQDNVQAALVQVSTSETARDNAQNLLKSQQFANAQSQAEAAVNALNEASSLSQAVTSLASELENYRSWWPSKAATASDTIEANRSQVTTYGSYDYSAQTSFNQAVSLLGQAYEHANARMYEIACSLADQAATAAFGTGDSAEDAYDDEMARRAEEARRQAEEAQRQAEEAARRSEESSSYDGGGYYDPSPTYDSSPSYDYDGGGYEPSYDYDDGGGY